MNLNEVKKHVYLQIAIYIGVGICLILSLFAILIIPAKAQEQTTDITSTIRTNYDCPFGYNSSGYCAIQTNNGGGVRAFNTRYNGVLNGIGFGFPYYFNQNSNTEIIDIYSTSNDFRNNNINVYCYSYETSPTQSNSRSCSLRFISQKHIQVIFPYDSLQWHEIILASNNAITGVSNYLIQKVTLTYDDGQQDLTGIIDNATSNTTDIINNSNSNTQDIINAINEGTTDMCSNIFNYASYYASFNGAIVQDINPNTIKVYSPNVWGWLQYKLPTQQGETYHLKGQAVSSRVLSGDTAFIQVCGDVDCANILYAYENNGSFDTTFTATQDVYFRLFATKGTSPSTSNYYEVMISKEDKPFCAFGTRISKIDEQLKAQEEANRILNELGFKTDETNAYLKDDTDPSVDSSGIQNTINSVQTTNPLSYLLTLPTNLLSAIINGLSSNSCTDFEIGKFGHIGRHDFGTYTFKFPCINVKEKLGDSLYNTIDIFVSVGILVITIVKLYSTISNYLTLGAEDEVKSHSHFLTPMDFLGNILGGNISGVGNSISSSSGGGNW